VLSSIAIIGAVAFLVDAAGITDVSVTFVLALCLAAVGLGLFAAARWGGGGGLVFVGILVTLAVMTSAVASPAFEDGVGERTYEPTRVADVRREYRHGIGEMTVDLGDVDFPAGRSRIDVHMGIGHLEVLVPRDVRVAVDGTLDIGRLEVFGRAQDGIGNDVTTTTRVSGDRVLVLDVDAGIGNVEIGYEGGGAR
jgi:predicted membrane protein